MGLELGSTAKVKRATCLEWAPTEQLLAQNHLDNYKLSDTHLALGIHKNGLGNEANKGSLFQHMCHLYDTCPYIGLFFEV